MNLSERDYYLGFAFFQEIGPKRLKLLSEYFGSVVKAWQADKQELLKINLGKNLTEKFTLFREKFSFENNLEGLKRNKINYLTPIDQEYPGILSEIADPPVILFARGDTGLLKTFRKCIGVVGTRSMTTYGKNATVKIVRELVFNKMTVVSGMARGIDTVAHKTALENSGYTIAVLGTGIDVIYPPENADLYRQIINQNGLVVSEYPPGLKPTKSSFPLRNRIISGLSQGVLVIEGRRQSGALISARYALDQGREVFAVPGPINSPTSEGTAYLIKQGATVVSGVTDILEELGS